MATFKICANCPDGYKIGYQNDFPVLIHGSDSIEVLNGETCKDVYNDEYECVEGEWCQKITDDNGNPDYIQC